MDLAQLQELMMGRIAQDQAQQVQQQWEPQADPWAGASQIATQNLEPGQNPPAWGLPPVTPMLGGANLQQPQQQNVQVPGQAAAGPAGGGLIDQITRLMSHPLTQGTLAAIGGGLAQRRGASAGQRIGGAALGGLGGLDAAVRTQAYQDQIAQQAANQQAIRQQQEQQLKLAKEKAAREGTQFEQQQEIYKTLTPEQKKIGLVPALKGSETEIKYQRGTMALSALNDGADDILKNGQAKTKIEAMAKFVDQHPEISQDLPPATLKLIEKAKGAAGAANPFLKNFPLEQRGRIVEMMQHAGLDPDTDRPTPEVERAARESVQQSKVNVGVTIARERGSAYAESREKAQEKYQTWLRTGAPVDPSKVSGYVSPTGQTPQADPKFKDAKTLTPQALSDAGYRYINPVFQPNFRQSAIALTQIDRIEKAGEALFKGVKPGENIGNAFILNGKRVFGDAAVRGFDAVVLETLPTNAVASGLTAGRVGDKVIENIEKPIMPNNTDTYDSFKAKIKNIRQRARNNMAVYYGDGIDPALISGGESYSQPGATPGGQQPSADEIKAAKQRLGIQ